MKVDGQCDYNIGRKKKRNQGRKKDINGHSTKCQEWLFLLLEDVQQLPWPPDVAPKNVSRLLNVL